MRHGALAAAVDGGDRLDAYLRAKAELEVLSEQAYGDMDSTSMSHPPIGNFIRLKAAQDRLDAVLSDGRTSSEPVKAPSVAVSPVSVTNPPKLPVAPTPIMVDLPSTCIAAPIRLKAHANDDGAGCALDESPTEIVSTPCDATPIAKTARSSVLDVAPCGTVDADPQSTISVVTDLKPLPRSEPIGTIIPALAAKTVDGPSPPPMPPEQMPSAGLALVTSTPPTSPPAFDIDERYDDLEPDAVLPWHSFIERFFKSRVFADKTVMEYRRAYGVLIGIAPDLPFNEVRRRHMRTFIREVAALPGRKGRETASAQTQDKYLSAVKSIFSWAEDEGLCVEDHDPFGSIGPDNRNEDARAIPKRELTADELSRIFSLPHFIGAQSTDRMRLPGRFRCQDHRFWFVLFLIYSGLRLSEMKRLQVGEVSLVDNYWIIHAAYRGRRARKTVYSARQVPVHPDLIEIGFLKYMERRRVMVGNTGALFPEYDYGGCMSENILTDAEAKDVHTSLHSLRHNYIGMLHQAFPEDGNDDFRRRLGGHTTGSGDAHLMYGTRLKPSEIESFCEKFKLPVSIRHLAR